jgi:hypothetical protein
MALALVYLGPANAVVRGLTPCEQLFLARWLQLLYDEAHPHWSLRPLSIRNLRNLYPNNFNARNKQLVFAIEDELLRRLSSQAPDVNGVADVHPHSADYGRAPCATCKRVLTSSNLTFQDKLPELVERLIASIDSGDEEAVLALTPVIASEAVAANVPLRFMLPSLPELCSKPAWRKVRLISRPTQRFSPARRSTTAARVFTLTPYKMLDEARTWPQSTRSPTHSHSDGN